MLGNTGSNPRLGRSIGFKKEDRLVAVSNEKRMGLRSMGERVGLLGGKIRIHSRPTEGTKIFIEVPFQKKNDR